MTRRAGTLAVVVAVGAAVLAVSPASAAPPRDALADGTQAARAARAAGAFARAMGIGSPAGFWRELLSGQRWSIPPLLGRDVVVVPDRLAGPAARSWDAGGYSPITGEVYADGPSTLRSQARYAVRVRVLP